MIKENVKSQIMHDKELINDKKWNEFKNYRQKNRLSNTLTVLGVKPPNLLKLFEFLRII